jgi:hypothetical protein
MAREREPEPDVEIGAVVKAKKLRFRRVPETKVELTGDETTSGSERENLPEEVEPGVTYRDVDIRWRATARLPDAPGERDRR